MSCWYLRETPFWIQCQVHPGILKRAFFIFFFTSRNLHTEILWSLIRVQRSLIIPLPSWTSDNTHSSTVSSLEWYYPNMVPSRPRNAIKPPSSCSPSSSLTFTFSGLNHHTCCMLNLHTGNCFWKTCSGFLGFMVIFIWHYCSFVPSSPLSKNKTKRKRVLTFDEKNRLRWY